MLAIALGLALLTTPTAVTGASAQPLPLPVPLAADAQSTALCGAVGSRPDRCLVSVVPGPVRNVERVRIAVDGTGTPVRVEVEQRLSLTGRGDYQVRERGPARSAVSLDDLDPPVAKLGAVVWQGFSPGRRDLAAVLGLDATLEAARLPLAVTLGVQGDDGQLRPLGPGGVAPVAGTLVVTVRNTTGQDVTLPAAGDLTQAGLTATVTALDTLRTRATRDRAALATIGPSGERLPVAGGPLPAAVDAVGPGARPARAGTGLGLTVTLRANGLVAGPAPTVARGPGVAGLSGVLPADQEVRLTATVPAGAAVTLDLLAAPALDPRALAPPSGASWAAWARQDPTARTPGGRVLALDALVAATAQSARAASYSPYLGADLPGSGAATFAVTLVAAEAAPVAAPAPTLDRQAVGVVGLAVLLLLGHGAALWARS